MTPQPRFLIISPSSGIIMLEMPNILMSLMRFHENHCHGRPLAKQGAQFLINLLLLAVPICSFTCIFCCYFFLGSCAFAEHPL